MKKTPMEDWIIQRTGISSANQDALEAYQLNKLIETLNYAKQNSVFYERHLADFECEDLKSLADFKQLPFTQTADIKESPFSFLCVSQTKEDRIVTLNTSGTSGKKKRIFFTDKDLQQTVDFFNYGMRSLTDSTDRVLVLLPGQAYGTIGDLLQKALNQSQTACTVFGLLTDLEAVEKSILENDINCIIGIPIQLLYLSRMKSEAFKKIEKILLSTDYVPQVLIDELNQKFDCQVFNHYGMTEMGYGGGVECQALNGYHLREGDLYFEIIDPDSGQPLADGEYGEVVFTTFNREAMPLIRYRTGDIGAFSTEPCTCGTFLRTLKKVEGRLGNRLQLSESGWCDLKVMEELILEFEEIIDYQVILENNEALTINITLYDIGDEDIIRKQVVQKIQGYFLKHYQLLMNVKININWEQRPDQMINSMIKRKIVDQRKEHRDEGFF
ncbi:MAG: AMP-binding protein [Acetobacterium sp.]|nr:AMP-binding protein [Acetobacterium sp.]